MILIITFILLWILIISALFLAKELFKKFKFWKDFQKHHSNQVSWKYEWNKNPGMYTIEMRWKKLFRALIGFDFFIGPLTNVGYDTFWYIESDENWILYFSAYLWRWPVELIFLVDGANAQEIDISCIDDTNPVAPKYIFNAHWWQKIGFFG